MPKIKLPTDKIGQIRRTLHFDSGIEIDSEGRFTRGGRIVQHTQQDVQPVLDVTKYMRDEMDGDTIPDGNIGVHAAMIPMPILYDIMDGAKTEAEREARLKAWLNDPDNRGFRTWKGRV